MDNADLEKLRISPGRLTPKFSPNITNYNAILGSDVNEVKLTTITSDSGASTTIRGDATTRTVQLQEGNTSTVEIVVTAEDGRSTKIYVLLIRRLSANDAFLSQLEISAGRLQPLFSPTTFTYYCDLPSNVTQVAIRTKSEDPKIQAALKGGAPVGTVTLSAGLTLIDVLVTSPNGKNTSTYTINAMRLQSPYIFQLKLQNPSYHCAVCNATPHCPCRVNGDDNVYCKQCLMEMSRVNKSDPMKSKPLGENWLVLDQEIDRKISEQSAFCNTPFGRVEGSIGGLPALISQQNKSKLTTGPAGDSNSASCEDCSKKVPSELKDLHKQISCSSKLSEPPFKTEVKQLAWEKIFIDDSLPSNLDEVLKRAKIAEDKYLTVLRDQDPASGSAADVLDLLKKAGSCYATAIQISSKDPRGHVGLGVVMEEMFYVEDMYGMRETESSGDDLESDAEVSSKEEEFLAICKLHGVSETATLAQQLRAVEAEYKSLKQAGQGHKAEHVQQLYQWKSKKALEASKGSYSVDTESPLYKAKLKFEHAVSVRSTDHSAYYHLGRIYLLIGDIVVAEKCLKYAASLKPTHSETLLCLGKSLQQSNPSQAKLLIAHGLGVYVGVREEVSTGSRCGHLQSFHASEFWRPTNTLIGESFLSLGHLGGHSFLDQSSCYKLSANLFSLTPGLQKGNTVRQLLWILIRARVALADKDMKNKAQHAGIMCRQVSALINHCQLPPTEELRILQMKIFEDGVAMEPTNSIALMRLGSGQLQQFEATSDESWLTVAEKSFRASIACEGKPDNGEEPPKEITEQPWWKKRKEAKPGTTSAPPTAKTSAPPTGTTSKQPTSKNAIRPVVGKTAAMPSKQPTTVGRGTRQQPTPAKQVSAASKGGRGGSQAMRGKGVATLGELKGDNKKPVPTTNKQQSKEVPKTEATPIKQDTTEVKPVPSSTDSNKPSKLNEVSYHPRLGLARVLAKNKEKSDECIMLYNEVIKMASDVHDAYIELGEILAKSDPTGAVTVYSKFPFSDPPSFDDAYLHGEIVRLLMSSSSYDDPQLVTSMIAMGRALGIAVLDKTVSILEAKFKTKVLKKVYAGVHGKDIDNPELQAFFKFKCWI